MTTLTGLSFYCTALWVSALWVSFGTWLAWNKGAPSYSQIVPIIICIIAAPTVHSISLTSISSLVINDQVLSLSALWGSCLLLLFCNYQTVLGRTGVSLSSAFVFIFLGGAISMFFMKSFLTMFMLLEVLGPCVMGALVEASYKTQTKPFTILVWVSALSSFALLWGFVLTIYFSGATGNYIMISQFLALTGLSAKMGVLPFGLWLKPFYASLTKRQLTLYVSAFYPSLLLLAHKLLGALTIAPIVGQVFMPLIAVSGLFFLPLLITDATITSVIALCTVSSALIILCLSV